MSKIYAQVMHYYTHIMHNTGISEIHANQSVYMLEVSLSSCEEYMHLRNVCMLETYVC